MTLVTVWMKEERFTQKEQIMSKPDRNCIHICIPGGIREALTTLSFCPSI